MNKKEFEIIVNNYLPYKAHRIYTTGSGRFSKYSTDIEPKVRKYVEEYNNKNDKKLILAYGNDAPRGGRLGDYIIIKLEEN